MRTLVRARGFAAVAIHTLAISIGGTAAIFTSSTVFCSSRCHTPIRTPIVRIWERTPTGFNNWVSAENFRLEASGGARSSRSPRGHSDRSRLPGEKNRSGCAGPACRPLPTSMHMASKAARGRTFSPDEDQPGKERVVVLSHRLWATQFGNDPGIVGRTIVAALTRARCGVAETSAFDPRVLPGGGRSRSSLANGPATFTGFQAAGPAETGVTLEQARAEMDATARRSPQLSSVEQGPGTLSSGVGTPSPSMPSSGYNRSPPAFRPSEMGCPRLRQPRQPDARAGSPAPARSPCARRWALDAAVWCGSSSPRASCSRSAAARSGSLGYGMIAGLARLLPPLPAQWLG